MNTKKMTVLSLFFALVMVLSACGGDSSDGGSSDADGDGGQKVYEIKYANMGSETGLHSQTARQLGEELNRRSMEKLGYEAFNLIDYPNSQLATSDAEQFEMVMKGTLQYSTCPATTLYQYMPDYPELNVLDLPYLFSSHRAYYDFCYGDYLQDAYDYLLNDLGVRVAAHVIIGEGYVSSNEREIHLPEDIAGLKIRTQVSDIIMATMEAYGANPTPIAFGETYTALQQGTVDGVCGANTSFDDSRFYEVVDYMSDASGIYITNFEIWNEEWIQSLPEDVREVLLETLEEFEPKNREDTYEAGMAKADQVCEDGGCVVTKLTDEEKEAWREIAVSMYPEFAELCGGMENIESAQAWLAEHGY